MNARYFGLVPAAGSGSRFGADVLKQYSPLAGRPMLYHSIQRLLATPEVEIVFVVLPPGDTEFRRHDWRAFGERLAPRDGLWRAQTPQMFRHGMLVRALREAEHVTDEASAVEALGYKPKLVEGSTRNLKVTFPADLQMAERILKDAL